MTTQNNRSIIRASEVGQYAYCARAWWLQRVKGHSPRNVEALQRGTAAHAEHGRGVERAGRLATWALGLAALATVALVAWLATWFR